MSRIVKGAGFSITSEPGRPEKTKFHVTGFAKGTRELWVVIPGETRFEFVTLPQAMTKEEAIKHVAGMEQFQAQNYQTALNLERFLDKPAKEPKAPKKVPLAKAMDTVVEQDHVTPETQAVTLEQHEKKEEEVTQAFTPEAAAPQEDPEAARKAEFVRKMNLAKMKKIAEKKATEEAQQAVAPLVDPAAPEPTVTEPAKEPATSGTDDLGLPDILKR